MTLSPMDKWPRTQWRRDFSRAGRNIFPKISHARGLSLSNILLAICSTTSCSKCTWLCRPLVFCAAVLGFRGRKKRRFPCSNRWSEVLISCKALLCTIASIGTCRGTCFSRHLPESENIPLINVKGQFFVGGGKKWYHVRRERCVTSQRGFS